MATPCIWPPPSLLEGRPPLKAYYQKSWHHLATLHDPPLGPPRMAGIIKVTPQEAIGTLVWTRSSYDYWYLNTVVPQALGTVFG